jgi:hypothetical protein
METKEIAMLKHTRLLGTACVAAAALAAGPAAADTLQGFEGFANSTFTHTTFSDVSGDWNSASLGVGMALPVADIPNLNWEVDAQYQHNWGDGHSAETWDFGFAPFLAYAGSRWGLDLNYETTTHLGHVTNGGAFMEWYLMDNITLSAKGGYLHQGGTPQGGHGHYLAGAATFYPFPDLAITGLVDWTDVTTGGSLLSNPFNCLHCQQDVTSVAYTIDAEWLPVEDIGLAVYGGFTYDQLTVFKDESNDSVWHIGVKYYLHGGSLLDHHRNGTLNPILRGP